MARGSLDGRFRRVRRLEERGREVESPPTSETLQEIRAIDAEIAKIEEEMKALGKNPQDTPAEVEAFFARFKGLTLDEKIKALEEEIGRCQED
jgi:hypothetical protein